MRLADCLILTILVPLASAQFPELFPPPPADECVPPADGGLGPVLLEVMEIFPIWEMLDIFLEAVSYEDEVVQAILYLQGEVFGRIVYDVSIMDGWRHVIDYFCEELGVHLDYIFGNFAYIFGIKPNPRIGAIARRRPGVMGLFADIMDIMPVAEMRRIFADAYETNEYVRRAVAKVQGDEFRGVAEAIEASPEFADMTQRMRELGVDVDCLLCGLKWSLGWLPEECRC